MTASCNRNGLRRPRSEVNTLFSNHGVFKLDVFLKRSFVGDHGFVSFVNGGVSGVL